ncbi:MAG: O-antigen ligase family protein [bacterium]
MLNYFAPQQIEHSVLSKDLSKLLAAAGMLFFLLLVAVISDSVIWVVPAAVFAGVFLWLIFASPFAGLLILLFLIFSNIFAGLEIPGGFLAAALLVILATVVQRAWQFDLNFILPKNQLFFVALLLAALLLSIPFSLNQKVSMLKLIVWIKSIIIYLLVINLVTSKRRLYWCIAMILTALQISFFYGLYILYQGASAVLQGQTAYEAITRLIGLSHDPNIYAATLVAFLPVPLFLFFYAETRSQRVGGFLLFAALVAATIMTFSRGGILSLGLVLLMFVIKKRHYRSVLFISLIGAVVALFLIPAEIWDRFSAISNVRGDASVNERWQLLTNAWRLFLENPLLGIGLGNFQDISIQFISRHQPAHNIFLEIAAETGLPGLAVFLGLIWITLRYFEDSRRLFIQKKRPHLAYLAEALKLGFFGFLISCLFLSLQQDTQFWMLFGLAAAMRAIADLPEEELI